MKTVTFSEIRKYYPCREGLEKVLKRWKPKSMDEEISIQMILKSNDLDYAILALCAFKDKYEREWWLFKADVAELVLPNFEKVYPEDKRPRETIESVRLYADGKITLEELENKRAAAESAVRSVAILGGTVRFIKYVRLVSSAAMSSAEAAAWSADSYFESADKASWASAWSINSADKASEYITWSIKFFKSTARSKIKKLLLKHFG